MSLFSSESQRSSATVRVLAAVIARDGRFLLGLRPSGKRHAGCWEFPGGKVEAGESDHAAMARELREELAVRLRSMGTVYGTQRDGESPFEITFVSAQVDGEPQALEHAALAWVAPGEFEQYPMAEGDRWCAEQLRARRSAAG